MSTRHGDSTTYPTGDRHPKEQSAVVSDPRLLERGDVDRRRVVLIWAGILIAAALVRLTSWWEVFSPQGVRFLADTDPHYHVLRSLRIVVDFIRMDDSRAALVLAVVSGKGLQAALLMAKLQATLRVLAQECSSLGVCLGRANRVFHRDGIPGSFASLLSVEIRSDSGEVRFANAGHLPPLLVTANEVKTMSKGQPALGLRGESLYEEHRLTLEPGEIFFVCSDGLTEAVDEAGNFFGEERAVALAGTFLGLLADEIAARVTAAVDGFRRNARANDDLSFLILRKL